MAIVRATALRNFSTAATALSTCSNGTSYNLGGVSTTEKFFAGFELLQAASTQRPIVMTVQSASSSGFATSVTEATFGLSSAIGSSMISGFVTSTSRVWWRTAHSMSTGTSTAGSIVGIVSLGISGALTTV